MSDSEPDWAAPEQDDSVEVGEGRVIIHIDLDCFYAQVEVIKDPSLEGKCVGVKQKQLVITTNYEARKQGIPKSGFIQQLVKQFPHLVLVNGEDLKDYRKISKQVFDRLKQFGCPVERLGMDENYLDVTDIVRKRIPSVSNSVVEGNIFGKSQSQLECPSGVKAMLIEGTKLAKEIRHVLKTEIGLTSSAGIAQNKVLAKLVGSCHKPDQQTVIFPSEVPSLMAGLKGLQSIPGIGRSMVNLLKENGISEIDQLQNANLDELSKFLEFETAKRIRDLSLGLDPSAVKQSGLVQTIGLEDRFKTLTTLEECRDKLKWLLGRLIMLLRDDGRLPQTMKVSVGEFGKNPKKRYHKESRQMKVRSSLFQFIKSDVEMSEENENELLNLAMNLFNKMISSNSGLHVNLIGISFCDFLDQKQGKESIADLFKSVGSVKRKFETKTEIDESILSELPPDIQAEFRSTQSQVKKSPQSKKESQGIANFFAGAPKAKENDHKQTTSNINDMDIDEDVLAELPSEIQAEFAGFVKRRKVESKSCAKKPQKTILNYFQKH